MINILIVDDELDVKGLFEQRFRKEIKAGDIELNFAHNAQDALAYLKEHVGSVSLVLSDINMPGQSGLELLAAIKQGFINPPPVVMMITAYGDEQNQQKAYSLGADDFFTKPLDFGILKEKVMQYGNR
jgi:CheY-like chemotaxis protein